MKIKERVFLAIGKFSCSFVKAERMADGSIMAELNPGEGFY